MAKLEHYGGNPKVVIAVPEVTSFRLVEGMHDFILLCSDGIFDRMETDEAIQSVW
jgi:protein phosphatase 2C family protein 2/3